MPIEAAGGTYKQGWFPQACRIDTAYSLAHVTCMQPASPVGGGDSMKKVSRSVKAVAKSTFQTAQEHGNEAIYICVSLCVGVSEDAA